MSNVESNIKTGHYSKIAYKEETKSAPVVSEATKGKIDSLQIANALDNLQIKHNSSIIKHPGQE